MIGWQVISPVPPDEIAMLRAQNDFSIGIHAKHMVGLPPVVNDPAPEVAVVEEIPCSGRDKSGFFIQFPGNSGYGEFAILDTAARQMELGILRFPQKQDSPVARYYRGRPVSNSALGRISHRVF